MILELYLLLLMLHLRMLLLSLMHGWRIYVAPVSVVGGGVALLCLLVSRLLVRIAAALRSILSFLASDFLFLVFDLRFAFAALLFDLEGIDSTGGG